MNCQWAWENLHRLASRWRFVCNAVKPVVILQCVNAHLSCNAQCYFSISCWKALAKKSMDEWMAPRMNAFFQCWNVNMASSFFQCAAWFYVNLQRYWNTCSTKVLLYNNFHLFLTYKKSGLMLSRSGMYWGFRSSKCDLLFHIFNWWTILNWISYGSFWAEVFC